MNNCSDKKQPADLSKCGPFKVGQPSVCYYNQATNEVFDAHGVKIGTATKKHGVLVIDKI